MKLNSTLLRQPSGASDASNGARITRMAKPPETKYKRREDGQLVRLRRVRRRKAAESGFGSVPNPSSTVPAGRRVQSTSELGKAAPVQTKPNAVGVKKGRYRSVTPGTGSLIIKANPSDRKATPSEMRPMVTVDQML